MRSLENAQDAEADEVSFDSGDKNVPRADEYTRSLDVLLASAPQNLHEQHHQRQNKAGGRDIAYLHHTHNYQYQHQHQHHQNHHNHEHHQHQQQQPLPIRTRTVSAQGHPPSAAYPAAGHDALSHSAHSSMQPAGSWTAPQSPRSRVSSLATDYEGYPGASYTTVQEEPEAGPAPKVDPYIMAKVADTFFLRLAFLGGVAIDAWRTMATAHQEQERYAAQMDRELSLSEALVMWSNAAGAQIRDMTEKPMDVHIPANALHIDHYADGTKQQHEAATAQRHERHERHERPERHERSLRFKDEVEFEDQAEDEVDDDVADPEVEAGTEADAQVGDQNDEDIDDDIDGDDDDDDDDDEAALQYRQKQEERERLMRRASRVYDITTMFNAVVHWQAMAKEEASRTKVARRHLLRRKVFSAWRDQTTVDHARADCFALSWAVRRWTTALHRVQEENAKLAVQFYRRDLVTGAFWTWLRAHQERTAAVWASDRLKRQAVESWFQATIVAVGTDEAAAYMTRDTLLRTAAAKWSEQSETHALTFRSIEEHENETYLRAAVQDWSKEAFCRRQLRAVQDADEARSKAAALEIWRERAAEAQHRAQQLDLDIVDDYATHWRRETRLAVFRADYEYDLKADAVHSWVLAEKLAFFVRYRDERLLRKTCLALKAAFGSGQQQQPGHKKGERERERELARTADELYRYNAAWGLVSVFRDLSEKRAARRQIAEFLDHEAMATSCLSLWTAAVADHREMHDVAQRGAFYVGTANALSGWPAYAKEVRRERLRTTYHTFRREVKRQTAAECLAVWRGAALRLGSEARGSGAYATADQLRYEHETHTIFSMLNHWILETNDRLFQQSVAAEADAEAYLSRWRLQLADRNELGAAAAEHDTVTQLAGRWDDWELQAVQARARDHTASALLEKNDRRLGRRVLAIWQQELADLLYADATAADEDLRDLRNSRASFSSSSGLRWRGEEMREVISAGHGYSASLGVGANVGAGTGAGAGAGAGAGIRRLGASLSSPFIRPDELDDARGELVLQMAGDATRGTRPTSFLLHPITQTPVTTTAQRPFISGGGRAAAGGSYSVPAPGTTAPVSEAAAPQLPRQPSSAANQLRRLHRSTSTALYRQHEQGNVSGQQRQAQQQQQQQQQQQPTPFRSSTSLEMETEPATTPARATPYSHRLLQRRLQSAARLADSVQLGPMSEFDEVEAMEGVGDGADGVVNLGLRDYADADVSSEDDEDLVLGHGSTRFVSAAGRDREDKSHYITAAHAADTPTRPLFRPGSSSGRTVVPYASTSSRTPLPHQRRRNIASAATDGAAATPANNGNGNGNGNASGGMSRSVGGLAAPASASHFTRFRAGPSQLRKSAVVGAAAASGASASAYPSGAASSSFDLVTTTPMGPLPSPFERRLRAAYGDRVVEVLADNDISYDNEDYSTGQQAAPPPHAPLPVSSSSSLPVTVTPLRRLPLRASLAASTVTARTGARVTFADVERDRGE